MTLYITPFGRVARRRTWNQPREAQQRDDEYMEAEYDVFVPVNVKADDEAYTITAMLPGVKADDLSIQVINETVTLQGEIKDPTGEKDTFLLRETPFGKFYRVLRLPEPLDANKANADLTDGLLTLKVPKAEESRPRTIKVQNK